MSIDNKIGLQALAGLASSNPLVKTAIKYWWLALPAGWAFYSMAKERPRVTVGGVIADFSITFGPVISVIMLAEMMERNQKMDAAAAAAAPLPAPVNGEIREAQFSITSGRMAPGVPPGTTPNFKVPMQFPR